jgi:P-type E1-E2 ATPase
MIQIAVPGRRTYRLEHVVLDLNGTVAVGGQLVEGLTERVARLRESIEVHLATADTRGRQSAIDAVLGITATRIAPQGEATQKASFVRQLGAQAVCAIGNGTNDAERLRAAALAIAVLGDEELAVETLNAADVVAPHPNGALDLLLDPPRVVATLRR